MSDGEPKKPVDFRPKLWDKIPDNPDLIVGSEPDKLEDRPNKGNPKITGFLPKWFRDNPYDEEDEGYCMIGPVPDEPESNEELALWPCPFCGGKAIVDSEGHSLEDPDSWIVVCLECAGNVEDKKLPKAIKKWNTRQQCPGNDP